MYEGSPVTEEKPCTCIHMQGGYIRDPGCLAQTHRPPYQG